MFKPQETSGRMTRESGRAIFGADVAGYHQSRADYPDALYDMIAARLAGRSIEVIGEIGPGTGIATAQLMRFNPRRLVGFEPDSSLAAFLAKTVPAMEVIACDFVTAKVAGAFDLVAAAACFHWLEPQAALEKIRRMLRPGGCVALWWNVYREAGIGDEFAEAVTPLLGGIALPPSQGVVGHYSLDWKLHFDQLSAGQFVDPTFTIFRRERVMTARAARDLYASFSFIRALDPNRQQALLDSIEELVINRFGGTVTTIVLTPLCLATNPMGPH